VPVNPSPEPGYCPCGRRLHYPDPAVRAFVEGLVEDLGPSILVRCQGRLWRVDRHFIALHGLKASELPTLGFPEVTDEQVSQL
jgi:hypothetical protein